MNFDKLSRRQILGGTAAVALSSALPRLAFAMDMAVGFIYVGSRDDYGYNQAHAQGAAAVKKMPGVQVIEAESVHETKDCQQTMSTMIERVLPP